MEPPANKLETGRRRGFVLILVLAMLVLITGLIVAFFMSVTTESKVTQTFSNESGADLLAQEALNLAEGQIVQATSSQNNTGDANAPYTWSSQPGMIRTYDSQGTAANCYKLYSSGNMIVSSGNVSTEMQNDVPSTWNTQPANYTDLNSPVTDASGNLNFPIIDGNNLKSWNGALTYMSGTAPDIEGFSVQTSATTYNSNAAVSSTNNPVQMPVAWLYVLKDGSVVTPSVNGTASISATFSGSNAPTSTNPIVGRVAFWTDDETSKLNINTAGEGTPYAFPHTNTPTDLGPSNPAISGFQGFSNSPPASGEFNRYPGHPATTCLSVALGSWLDAVISKNAPTAFSSVTANKAYLAGLQNRYFNLTPRYAYGGSMAGTVPVTTGPAELSNTSYQPIPPGGISKQDRLYSCVDELLFTSTVATTSTTTRQQNYQSWPGFGGTSPLNNGAVERLKFFLSANSRAPEVTPFNTPKVSMWPQWYQPSMRTGTAGQYAAPGLKAAEDLLAFCSSFGTSGSAECGTDGTDAFSSTNLYFIQRYQDVGSDYGTGQIGWRSSYEDWNSVKRNRDLANYIHTLGSQAIPGYGSSLATKFASQTSGSPTSFSSLIIESVDMIRALVDTVDYETADSNMQQHLHFGSLTLDFTDPIVMTATSSGALPVAPDVTALKGFGVSPVITQVVVGAVVATSGTALNPFIALQLFFPTQSYPPIGNNITFTIGPMNNLGFPGWTGTDTLKYSNLPYTYPSQSPMNVVETTLVSGTTYGAIATSATATTFSFGTGNPITITLLDNFGQPTNSVTMTFQPVTLPKPAPGGALNTAIFLSPAKISARGMECSGAGPLRGDWRLLSCFFNAGQAGGQDIYTQSNPATPADYNTSTYAEVHSLRAYAGGDLNNALPYACSPVCIDTATNGQTSGTAPLFVSGSGVPNTSLAGSLTSALKSTDYSDFTVPCAPVGLTGSNVIMSNGMPGDWDTGPVLMPDGPYINPIEQWSYAGNDNYFYLNESGVANGSQINGPALEVYSPNRLVASPVRFGSLPTGFDRDHPQPWQTLLFCPNPAGRTTTESNQTPTAADHPGFGNPPDSAYLEFFTMPTVEPYAISEPLSTAGKVNLNYQIAPFTNIERSTALRGVLKSVLINAISPGDVRQGGLKGQQTPTHPTPVNGTVTASYKFNLNTLLTTGSNMSTRYAGETHYSINRDLTIAGFDEHFANQGLFRYPSEVCSMFLVPAAILSGSYASDHPSLGGLTADNMISNFWSKMTLTGDNLREEPYDRIYPRVCTKSNAFTIHYRVQALRKAPGSNPVVWQEGKDQVLGEYRGSSMIERYIDPGDSRLNSAWDGNTLGLNLTGSNAAAGTGATGIANANGADLGAYYKLRVIDTKKFAP